jgi:uncharacterized protein YqfA (UPF0365 family)
VEVMLFAIPVLITFFVVIYFVPVGLWVAALASGAKVGIGELIAMRLRRVPPQQIVNPTSSRRTSWRVATCRRWSWRSSRQTRRASP